MNLRDTLISTAENFCSVSGIPLWRASIAVAKDGKFFRRIKAGGDCSTGTYERAMNWFAASWPPDLNKPEALQKYVDRLQGDAQ